MTDRILYILKDNRKHHFPIFLYVCVCLCAVHIHQVWQVSWCALQVSRFAWLGHPNLYCTHPPSTRVTWSLCQGSTACAGKPRKSICGEVRWGEPRKWYQRFLFSVLVNKQEMHWGEAKTNHWQSADSGQALQDVFESADCTTFV